tara:strand:+ start:691 stop:2319 length:1629 start_codon:yes stop_codon:yes gene_type:complete
MVIKNSLNFINEFFFYISNQIRKIYLNSNFYNNKISKIDNKVLEYKPSLNILSCLVKYDKKRKKIDDFFLNSIWTDSSLKEKDYKKLHNFFWLFSLDLKSSKKITQSIILNWIENNQNYNRKNWDIDILSKRIISWISNSTLTYEESSSNFKEKFNYIIKKQINHLINEIGRSELVNDKMIGCSAIILTGLSYKDEKILNYGLKLLKKISDISFDNEGFPRSRSLRQLIFYLKYFVLIRELLKESQNEIPEYLDENIYYLGQAYSFIWQTNKTSFLFNGNHEIDHSDFDKYLQNQGYKFKNQSNEIGGYSIIRSKNIILAIDLGSSPEKKFSNNYQTGPLSFELIFLGKKMITNSGYFQNYRHRLNNISRSTVSHSTLTIDNNSVCHFKRDKDGNPVIDKGFKTFNKKIIQEKNFLSVSGSHDGYQKKYGIIHEREIQVYPEINRLIGIDKLIKKKNFKSYNFEIRFHFMPETKVTKTQDGKAVLIEMNNSGWKFTCSDHLIDIETGLYFGKKNSFTENLNLFISGVTTNSDQTIKWEIEKI